jgi:hypothetical protein
LSPRPIGLLLELREAKEERMYTLAEQRPQVGRAFRFRILLLILILLALATLAFVTPVAGEQVVTEFAIPLNNPNTRGQMAVLVKTFGLVLYGP